ncbi:hypothetical protein [Listeria newyorkensis]|uniref:hypothetical protein n=1 Tax=Listeria newyorkensis TaxID=1497681 RepID=UPI0035A25A1D
MQKDIHVVGAIIQKNNKILCVQRADSAVNGADWEFPGAKSSPVKRPNKRSFAKCKRKSAVPSR